MSPARALDDLRNKGHCLAWSLHQRLAEPLDALQALLDVGHAGGVAEADVIVGAEGNAGDGGDLLGFEQPGAEVGGLQAGLGDVREEVEGALGVDAASGRGCSLSLFQA